MISSTARDTVSAIGWSTAVSGGWVKRTIGVLSKLINDRSRGISSPRERALQRRERHLVVADDDRGRRVGAIQQRSRRLLARGVAEIARDEQTIGKIGRAHV